MPAGRPRALAARDDGHDHLQRWQGVALQRHAHGGVRYLPAGPRCHLPERRIPPPPPHLPSPAARPPPLPAGQRTHLRLHPPPPKHAPPPAHPAPAPPPAPP